MSLSDKVKGALQSWADAGRGRRALPLDEGAILPTRAIAGSGAAAAMADDVLEESESPHEREREEFGTEL